MQVFDTFEANASSTTSVTVSHPAEALSLEDIKSFSQKIKPDTSSPGNVNKCRQHSALTNALINEVDCSAAPGCYSLNRLPCRNGVTVNTCGDCLRGYVGDEGPSNIPCEGAGRRERRDSGRKGNRHHRQVQEALDFTCSVTEDCFQFEECVGGTCVLPLKACINNCSGHGQCVFVMMC
jgi:hypothetical protein